MSKFFFLVLMLQLLVFPTTAQVVLEPTDTMRVLPQVEVKATPLRVSPPGTRTEKWGIKQLQPYNSSSIAEILTRESGIFIKSYGLGSLATSSVRGGNAGHTAVTWNGFPIQSPMLGQLDLALLPSFFTDEMTVQYGGGSALWGSGAIGGHIALNSLPTLPRQGFSIHHQSVLGSFGWLGQQTKAQFNKGKWAGTSRYFYTAAANDFPYTTLAGVEKKQSNAALKQQGLMQNLQWKLTDNQELSGHIWWQTSDRQIPPMTTQNRSTAEQADDIFRSALEWKRITHNHSLNTKAAYFREKINYQDSLTGVSELTRFEMAIGEVESQWQLHRAHQLHVGINQTFTKAHSDNYESPPSQNQTALFAGYRFTKNKWKAQLNGRQEWLDGEPLPIVPSLGVECVATNWLTIKVLINRNYRYPTLNDRYWQPGGKPDLKAEHGWSQELTINPRLVKGKSILGYEATAFNRNISDWILWAVNPGEYYHSPSNITEVWSRGLEQRIRFTFSQEKYTVQFTGAYDYILSTSQKDVERPLLKAGEQLIYVPEHQAFASLSIYFKSWNFSYQHRYTGPVSTQTEPLEGYQVGYCFLQKDFNWKSVKARLFFSIDNAWNATYRVIERRPMPGRHYRVGLAVDFEKIFK